MSFYDSLSSLLQAWPLSLGIIMVLCLWGNKDRESGESSPRGLEFIHHSSFVIHHCDSVAL